MSILEGHGEWMPAVHTVITEGTLAGSERFVGRVEVVNGLLTIHEEGMEGLEALLLIPRFGADGTSCSMTEEPLRYLEQLTEDLREGATLRATPLHRIEECPSKVGSAQSRPQASG